MKVIPDFETELKQIDKDLSVRPNKPHKVFPELDKIATVLWKGAELFSIPSDEIYDETNPNYGVDLRQDGRIIPHRNRIEAIQMAQVAVERLHSSKDYRDLVTGKGVYSDAALNAKDPEPAMELVEDVPIEIKEITSENTLPK